MLRFAGISEADIPELRELAHRIWHAHYPSIISPAQIDYMLARMFAPEAIRQDLAAGILWEFVFQDKRAVGFLSCIPEPPTGRIKLSKLYLVPELHGRGVGRQMLDRIKAYASSRKAREVYLTVNKRNTIAVRAYQSAGFQITGETVADIGSGYVMDDYLMSWEVSGIAPA